MSRFERHARTVSLLTLVSRFTGLARDAVISRCFGAGMLTDAFFFAFLVPNLFRRLFGEGALTAAFIPVYTRLERDDPARARALATLLIARLVIVLGVVTLVGELLLFALAAWRGTPGLAIQLTMIMLPYMPLVCVVALLGGMAQVHGRFGPAASAPIILNGCLIAAAAAAPALPGVTPQSVAHVSTVAAAVVVAGVGQALWALLALRGHEPFARETDSGRDALRDVLRQAGPMILGLGVLQLNTLLDGFIASYPVAVGPTIAGIDYPLSEGAMSAVSFAQRLYQFPLGVFGIAVATAIFPLLARLSDDAPAFADAVRRGVRLVVFIGLPASAGLLLVGVPLAGTILEGGDFGRADTERVARVLTGYAPAIWAYSMTHVLTRAFYARGEASTPVRIAIAVVGLNVVLNMILIWTPLAEAGLAWSTALCAVVQVTALVVTLRRRLGVALITPEVRRSWAQSIGATLVMSGAVFGAQLIVASLRGAATGWFAGVLELGVAVAVGAAVYAIIARVLRMPELRAALGREAA